MSATAEQDPSPKSSPTPKRRRGGSDVFGDMRQWLGMNGDSLGTSGRYWRTFFYAFATAAAIVGVVNAINVITITHENPGGGVFGPIVTEGSSWITFLLFFWIPWVAWRMAPPLVRPRWKLLLHAPAALAFSLAHVVGFVILRKLAFQLAGDVYEFGPFLAQFLYEIRKDALGYALFFAGFTLIDHLLRQQSLIDTPGQTLTFDIRDGARLNRVRLDEILAIASAGNYVEFVLRDGRKLLMRASLSATESELAPRGFVRTHRSWLINAKHVTALKPDGSGDYSIELEKLSVPLSRRFPDALARLRQPTA
jgi:LytTr DNA-binding domain